MGIPRNAGDKFGMLAAYRRLEFAVSVVRNNSIVPDVVWAEMAASAKIILDEMNQDGRELKKLIPLMPQNMGYRAVRALIEEGYTTIQSVKSATDKELRGVHMFGECCLRDTRRAIERLEEERE